MTLHCLTQILYNLLIIISRVKYIYTDKICPPDKTDRHITTYLYRIKSENGVYSAATVTLASD